MNMSYAFASELPSDCKVLTGVSVQESRGAAIDLSLGRAALWKRVVSCWISQTSFEYTDRFHVFHRNIGLQGVGDEEISSLIISQMCSRADQTDSTEHPHNFSPRRRQVMHFLAQFNDRWELNRHPWGGLGGKGSSEDGWGGGSMALTKSRKDDVFFQYHMRVFTTGSRRACLGRLSGNLTGPSDVKRNLDIHEFRCSVGLKTTWELDLPVYTLVTMTNSFTGLEDLGELCDARIWKAADIRPSIRATGVAAFAFRIRTLLPGWADQWSRLLDQIDRVLSGDVSN
jgi:hypothetical protein